MKRWIPDFANESSTNLIVNGGQTITATDTGFIFIVIGGYREGGAYEAFVLVNGKKAWRGYNNNAQMGGASLVAGSTIIPVIPGDVITGTHNGTYAGMPLEQAFFIPGKWV